MYCLLLRQERGKRRVRDSRRYWRRRQIILVLQLPYNAVWSVQFVSWVSVASLYLYIRFMITDDYYYKIVFMNCRHHLQLQIRSNKQTHRYTIATNVNRIHKARQSSYSIPIKHASTECVKSSRPTMTRYNFNKQFSWFFSLLNSARICGGRCS